MLNIRKTPTMSRRLASRLIITALTVSAALFCFYFAKYMLDVPNIRQSALRVELAAISAAIAKGRDPAAEAPFSSYPTNYGFRVLEDLPFGGLKVVSEVNSSILPPLPKDFHRAEGAPDEGSIAEGFLDLGSLPGGAVSGADHWMISDLTPIGARKLWIQIAMVGDPAWLWGSVIETELIDHVVVPVGVLVPLMTLAAFFTVRQTLRPLSRVASQAQALGRAVRAGRTLQPLSIDGLPREIVGVVVAINAMLDRLETSFLHQKQFTADVAHELRTPLAVLRLQVSDLPATAPAEQIIAEVDALGALVNQLLRFAQAEDAMLAAQRPVDLTAVSRKVCEELAPVAVQRGQTIEFDAPQQKVVISGQADLVDIAVRNVVDNAIKASPNDSTVAVTVSRNGTVAVEDHGPGIPDRHKEAIFTRFWRADPRRNGGVGIGLALVRQIVELHDGDVRVEDRAGGGARFILAFGPVQPLAEKSPVLADSRAGGG
jgi:signal transduction histidine kinase